MLEYNEIRQKKFIVFEGEPYEVLASHVFRKQQRKPVNQTKLKNLISGRIAEHSFHQSDKAEEAEIAKKSAKYLYSHRGEHWFTDPANPRDRFKLDEDKLGDALTFLKQDTALDILVFGETVIAVRPPIKVELKVTEAPPGVKGDSAQGGTKQITLETGAIINAPLFVNEGDVIRVNTETGEYVERA